MGVTIFYRGSLTDLDRIEDFLEFRSHVNDYRC